MKHLIKFIVGFLIVYMTLCLFVLFTSQYGAYVLYGIASIIAIFLCYDLGDSVCKIIWRIYNERKFK